MKFEVTILGSSSATPIYNRNPTSQLLNLNDHYFLIDCGEGTQQQLLRNGIKAQRIDYIFISHLHGDHYLGLVGLLSSLHLNGRTKPITIFAPPPLKDIIDIHFKYSETNLRYPIIFKATQNQFSELILETNDVKVETIILEHRIPCTGFKFSQKKRLRKIIKEKVEALKIPVEYIPMIKRGIDYRDKQGKVYSAMELTTEADEPKSYAYCSDTINNRNYLDVIKGVDTLYHEATFLHDMLDRAKETFHTTALEAGTIALEAGVKKLLIGHFSARYKDLEPLLTEVRSIFPSSELAIEGQTFEI
ncbi:ribonuclease Z [Rubrolithibacter danxiaensis]|uniref:ribonuclease Z n=1 Tax=Rubrolithibacter danxiaensis TaxID=3390805 RepID=UPI003BF85771